MRLSMVTQLASKWLKTLTVGIEKLAIGIVFCSLGLQTLPAQAESKVYNPPAITSETEISDILTKKDIPTGDGGFARDYIVELEKGDQVTIDLTSDNFDSMVMLIAEDGAKVAENDDGAPMVRQIPCFFPALASQENILLESEPTVIRVAESSPLK